MILRASCLALLACAVACKPGASDFHGQLIAEPLPAASFALTDDRGRVFDLAQQRGKVALIYFGYTHCPDVCPATLSEWSRVSKDLGTDAEKVRFVFVSVDPGRDTPAIVGPFARQFDSSFVGVSGTPAQIDAIAKSWGFAVEREQTNTPGAYGVGHPAQVFVVDKEGRVFMMFPPGTDPKFVAADIRHLI